MKVSRVHRPARRGFGTFVAILLLLIVAATLPVLAGAFAANAKRTHTQAQDAQLRQLLTAGAAFAARQATAGANGATTRSILSLPQELVDDGASVTISFSRDRDHLLDATIHATLGRRSMEQSLRFERRDGAWQPVAATLNAEAPTSRR